MTQLLQLQVQLADVGLETLVASQAVSRMCALSDYISPEGCQNKPYDLRAEMWCIGCLAHQVTAAKRHCLVHNYL